MLRALLAAPVLLLALAAPARADAELSSIFESVARSARALEVEPPEPIDWFPVRGVIDFGEGEARFGSASARRARAFDLPSWRGGRRHEGQDVLADAGTPIVAVQAGRVVEKGNDGGRGNYLAIWTPQPDLTFVYLHMRAPARLALGRDVAAGKRIGAVGCTGSCSAPHLHLETRRGRGTTGKPLDPLPMLKGLAERAR